LIEWDEIISEAEQKCMPKVKGETNPLFALMTPIFLNKNFNDGLQFERLLEKARNLKI